MKERPILFKGELVRAILDGRKTVTRRLVTVPWHKGTRSLPYEPYWVDTDGELYFCDEYGDYHPATRVMQPYGVAGDRLWVKEPWRPRVAHWDHPDALDRGDVIVRYSADGAEVFHNEDDISPTWRFPKAARSERGNVSPLLMPRWASRLTLEVTDVRVERLHTVTEDDARAEGVTLDPVIHWTDAEPGTMRPENYREAFRWLWDSINGKRAPWASNPYVWRVEFRRLDGKAVAAG